MKKIRKKLEQKRIQFRQMLYHSSKVIIIDQILKLELGYKIIRICLKKNIKFRFIGNGQRLRIEK